MYANVLRNEMIGDGTENIVRHNNEGAMAEWRVELLTLIKRLFTHVPLVFLAPVH